MSKTSLLLFLCISFACIKPEVQAEEGCPPARCGNVTVSAPFGIVSDAEDNRCAQLAFQVHCFAGEVPYLGYYEPHYRLRILDIFYANASLLVSDVHKLADFSNGSGDSCRVPVANTASKIGQRFSISGSNWYLVFYNCTKAAPARAVRERAGLVETLCRNNTFVRGGDLYGEPGDYAIEGCNATNVTVRGSATGKVNASDYRELISDGFLLAWQPPPGSKRIGRKILLIDEAHDAKRPAAVENTWPAAPPSDQQIKVSRRWSAVVVAAADELDGPFSAMVVPCP